MRNKLHVCLENAIKNVCRRNVNYFVQSSIRTFQNLLFYTSQEKNSKNWGYLKHGYALGSQYNIYIQGVPKKCIHILRDVIYVYNFSKLN
jgi:hypothetical protein